MGCDIALRENIGYGYACADLPGIDEVRKIYKVNTIAS
jgi:hypothetical protein